LSAQPTDNVTRLLIELSNGDRGAVDLLLPVIYDELRKLAANYLRRERPDLDVGRPHLQWNAEGSEESLAYLPGMRTDIVLRDSERTIVIDAKYYSHALSEHFGKRSLHSENLYQLFAYMRHLAMGKPAASVTGMLVYPRTTETVRVDVAIFGHPVVATALNLSQSWPELSKDLLDLLPAAAG